MQIQIEMNLEDLEHSFSVKIHAHPNLDWSNVSEQIADAINDMIDRGEIKCEIPEFTVAYEGAK